jgi:hypothetical protein
MKYWSKEMHQLLIMLSLFGIESALDTIPVGVDYHGNPLYRYRTGRPR